MEVCVSKGTNISLTPKEEREKGKNVRTSESQIVTLHQETAGVQASSSRLLLKKKKTQTQKASSYFRDLIHFIQDNKENKVKKQGTDLFGTVDLLKRKGISKKGRARKTETLSMVKMQSKVN